MKTRLMQLLSVLLCSALLLSGCGSDAPETDEAVVTPTEEKRVPSYYPDAIGNRWVYRESDGFEWERIVSKERVIQGRVYRVFDYNPPIEDAPFDYLKMPSYRVTQNRVLFFVGEEINRYFEVDFAEVQAFWTKKIQQKKKQIPSGSPLVSASSRSKMKVGGLS